MLGLETAKHKTTLSHAGDQLVLKRSVNGRTLTSGFAISIYLNIGLSITLCNEYGCVSVGRVCSCVASKLVLRIDLLLDYIVTTTVLLFGSTVLLVSVGEYI